MKKTVCLLLFAAGTLFAGEAVRTEAGQAVDVYETGRYDFDRDGTMEQIVITSGGGSGGAIWYIARLNGEKLSGEIQGNLTLLKSRPGFCDLCVKRKIGADEQIFELYRFIGGRYKCIRRKAENNHGK
ncbi:MAG: hypothetical protein E7041_05140 [Lentisphaerae bacterium]|nr:hypothetical protein [Lentisphaerota bacterium]